VSCAGLGQRLGVGTTKALVPVLGRPLIAWQLDLLREVEDVRIVVGYQSAEMIQTVLGIRRDVLFVYNRDYATTGTAGSLALGARHAAAEVVSLDGDLLVHPDDLRAFLRLPAPVLGTLPASSDEPVYVRMEQGCAAAFSRERGDAEWSGLVKFPSSLIDGAVAGGRVPQNVYELLESLLPIPAVSIRATEIDTPDDYLRTVDWLRRHRGSFAS